jgi:hypothetical protein
MGRGRNYFYELHEMAKHTNDWFTCIFKASETDIIDNKELTAAKDVMSPEAYQQEMECSFQAGISGSYYGNLIEELDKKGRIKDFEIDDEMETETWWDLGMNDSTVILFAQRHNGEIRIIDSYENSGEGLDHYLNIIDSKPYNFSKHIAPHDIRVRELGTNKSRWETAKELGLEFDNKLTTAEINNLIKVEEKRIEMSKKKEETDKSTFEKGMEAIRKQDLSNSS